MGVTEPNAGDGSATRPLDMGKPLVDIVSTSRVLDHLDQLDRDEQRGLLDVVGTLEWDDSYDYKAERSRRQES